ncbi:hypothetical protein CATYP_01775 [Corynebacterium atypicum]|uniref:Uncharacterized protein n=1 Tax=Corynebacterium atypicum TaxID=191610 RepID=A0ABN4DBU1_9CORY|nr:hypothetical protein [Corynebacterium atypicum]AIG63616.1 hypothetical protein CATYP_01775 [Corynebacterium atypicum]
MPAEDDRRGGTGRPHGQNQWGRRSEEPRTEQWGSPGIAQPTEFLGRAGNSDRTEYLGRAGGDSRTEYLGNPSPGDDVTRYFDQPPAADATRFDDAPNGAFGANDEGPVRRGQFIPPPDQRGRYPADAAAGYPSDGYETQSSYGEAEPDYDRDRRAGRLRRYQEGRGARSVGKVLGVVLGVVLAGLAIFFVGRMTADDGAEEAPVTTTEHVTSTQRTTVTKEPTERRLPLPSELPSEFPTQLPSFERPDLPELPDAPEISEEDAREWWQGLMSWLGEGEDVQ